MNFYRDSFFLNITSIIRNIYGIVRGKVSAILLGIEGVGVLGQINAFFGLQGQISNLGFNTILVNRLGKIKIENEKDSYLQLIFFSLSIIFLVNIILLTLLIFFRNQLSILLFGDQSFANLFILLAFLGPIFAFANIFETISQVRKNFKKLYFGRNIGNIFGIISFLPLVYFFSYYGIIISFYLFVISSGLYFLVSNFDLIKQLSFRHLNGIKSIGGFLLKFSLIDMTRRTSIFASILFLRIIIVHFLGIEKNGLFQSIWSISYYPEIFLGAFSSIYYPLISEASSKEKIKEVMQRNFEYLTYILFPFIAIIMLFPDILLKIFYTQEFLQMTSLLKILVFVQFIQAIYYYYSITFLGQTYLNAFLVTEVGKSVALVLAGYLLIPILDIEGAVLSIVLMTFFAITITSYFISKYPIIRLTKREFRIFLKFFVLLFLLFIPIPNGILWRIIHLAGFILITSVIIDFKKYRMIIWFK